MMDKLFSVITNPLYFFPLGVALLTFIGLWLVKNVVVSRLQSIASHTETYIDDVILAALLKTNFYFIIGSSLYAGCQAWHLDGEFGHLADKAFVVLVAIQVILWSKEAIDTWFEFTLKKKNNDPAVKTTLGFVSLLIKLLIIVTVILFALNNLGVNVTTFIAGLGVGGIAIALATQNILGDLFSSLSIVMDKPFIVGDYISLGEWMGTIEHIGLKTTRLRSLSGEQIVISNTDLLSSKIRNFKRMSERRVIFQLGVTYQTSREAIKLAPKLIEDIIVREKLARFDRAHFFRYGAFSIDFEIVYWVLSPDYREFADTNERILLEIHEAFEKNNLDFAYPTQTLMVEQKHNQS